MLLHKLQYLDREIFSFEWTIFDLVKNASNKAGGFEFMTSVQSHSFVIDKKIP